MTKPSTGVRRSSDGQGEREGNVACDARSETILDFLGALRADAHPETILDFSALYGLVAAGEWILVLGGGIGWRAVIAALFTLAAIAYLVSALRWRGGASHDDEEASPAGS